VKRALTECGDASACLKLRTPLIQRDRPGAHQIACRSGGAKWPAIYRLRRQSSCAGDAA